MSSSIILHHSLLYVRQSLTEPGTGLTNQQALEMLLPLFSQCWGYRSMCLQLVFYVGSQIQNLGPPGYLAVHFSTEVFLRSPRP